MYFLHPVYQTSLCRLFASDIPIVGPQSTIARWAAMGRIRHVRLDHGGFRPPLASPKGDLPQGAATSGWFQHVSTCFNPSE